MKLKKNILTNNTSDVYVCSDSSSNLNAKLDTLYDEYANYETWRCINKIVELIYKDESIPMEERVLVKNVLEGYSKRNLK